MFIETVFSFPLGMVLDRRLNLLMGNCCLMVSLDFFERCSQGVLPVSGANEGWRMDVGEWMLANGCWRMDVDSGS